MPKHFKDDFDDEVQDYEPKKADGETIKKSLESIKYQTSRHLCINTGLSIGTILDWLETFNLTGEVSSEMVGSLPAYYLPGNEPQGKLFLGGDNSVHVRPEEKPAHTSTRKIGDVVTAAELPKPDERGLQKRKVSPVAEIAHPQIDPTKLEELAAVNPKQKEIAAALGIKYSSLYSALQTSTAAYNAYHRGKVKHMKNQELQNKIGAAALTDPPEIPQKITSTLQIRQILTLEIVEDAAFNRISTQRLAERYGIAGGKLIDALLYKKVKGGGESEMLQAWKRGKQKLLKLDHAKEIVSEMPKTVDAPDTVEKFVAAREKTKILTPEKIVPSEKSDENQQSFRHPLRCPHIYERATFRGKCAECAPDEHRMLANYRENLSEIEKSFTKQTGKTALEDWYSFEEFIEETGANQRLVPPPVVKIPKNEDISSSQLSQGDPAEIAPKSDENSQEKFKMPKESFLDHRADQNDEEMPGGDWKIVPAEKDESLDVDPRFAHQLEHISENGFSKTSIEEKKAEFLESLPKIPARAFPIPSPNANGLQIDFTGDFFRLPEHKRIMLLQVAKLKDAFEAGEA